VESVSLGVRQIPTITATSFQRSFDTGTTKPAVFVCEDERGNSVGEYVVKTSDNAHGFGTGALLREIVGSCIATELDLNTPEPAIIVIEEGLSSAISEPPVAETIRKSVGKNFGSRYLSGGYIAWPNDGPIVPDLRSQTTDIFVFDTLIQNPDRRRGKPNLLWKDNELVVIDHEMAFAFLIPMLIAVDDHQWLTKFQPYLRDHIFYRHLCHTKVDLDRISLAVEDINNDFWVHLESIIPDEWKGEELTGIRRHVESIQQHLDEFMDDIRRYLS
jgi:hypothetical protein